MDRPGWHSRGYLPHCDADGLAQHIVFRLADSLPASVLAKLAALDKIKRFAACEGLLDSGIGAATLEAPGAAQLVENSLLKFDGERYALLAWCVVPDHVHVVVEPFGEHALGAIVKSWKAFSAARINELEGRSGRLWAPDYFDRYMRSAEHLATTIAYVENNPVAAGLCERPEHWSYSSAAARVAPEMRV